MNDRSDEIRRLQRCINDLISLLALPAMWSGQQPPQVVGTLLDVLLRLLRLDFVYIRVKVGAGGSPLETVRVAQDQKMNCEPLDVDRTLLKWVNLHGLTSDCRVPNPVGEGEVSIAHFWLGLEKDMGVVVAGSQRAGFPSDIETLLLKSAVNQAVIELQAAQVRAEQKRADESERVKKQLHAENIYLRQELDTDSRWGEIVGQSKVLKKALKLVEQVAPTSACVLIQGETGTGKELIARAIHRLSDRKERPFVKMNCAAIPTGLLESELFGHERGSFTGAIAQKSGRFELAHRGTIFLDEVGDISLELQAKLLRVLQEREFERLGSTKTIRVDVRLVAASNRNLEQMVEEGAFRSDLYYRLKVFPIVIPPLRERSEDIPLLIRFFTKKHSLDLKKSITTIPADTMDVLCRWTWPGNIRELENFIERCVILSPGETLEAPLTELRSAVTEPSRPVTLHDAERDHIRQALLACRWVIAGPSGAAAKLGMKRTSLQYKIQKLGIDRSRE
ncbi:MAG: sigma 54-interacting transcriptional regulator [Nitrospira sp.]|nr:sigma 54-interacting transcriptional regulator [Nitrospira sp.]